MGTGLEKVKDGFHAGLDGCRGCVGDIFGEILVGLAACGLLALAWWSYQTAPYPTVSITVGVGLISCYGVVAFVRDVRGTRLVRSLGVAAALVAGVVVLLLMYLPTCACLE